MDDSRHWRAVWLATTDGSVPPRPYGGGSDGDGSPALSPHELRPKITGNHPSLV